MQIIIEGDADDFLMEWTRERFSAQNKSDINVTTLGLVAEARE